MNGTVVITGASSGIGEACAHAFAKLGAKLVLGARRKERLDAVARAVLGHRSPAVTEIYAELDMTKAVELKPGRHTLVVSGGDYETLRREFSTSEGENPPLTLDLVAKAKKPVTDPAVQPPARLEEPFVGHARPVRGSTRVATGQFRRPARLPRWSARWCRPPTSESSRARRSRRLTRRNRSRLPMNPAGMI